MSARQRPEQPSPPTRPGRPRSSRRSRSPPPPPPPPRPRQNPTLTTWRRRSRTPRTPTAAQVRTRHRRPRGGDSSRGCSGAEPAGLRSAISTPELSAEADEPPAEPAATPEPAEPTALEALQARFAVRPQVPEPEPEPATPLVHPGADRGGCAPSTRARLAPSLADVGDPSGGDSADSDPSARADRRREPFERASPRGGARRSRREAAPTEDEVKEILTGVLDRLGAAHHRPFSRA